MREEDSSLAISKSGVLCVTGFDTSLRVLRRQLVVRTVLGRQILEATLPRVRRPRLRRVVVVGTSGYASFEALDWIDGVGASFLHISRDGRIIATTAEAGPNQPALRRAQVAAAESEVGLSIVRLLLEGKLRGHLDVLRDYFAGSSEVISILERATAEVGVADSVRSALATEARAASAYWSAWRRVPIRFARSDERHLPPHWKTFGERQSPLGTSPRNAVTAAGAILNYLYALAESESRLALLAVGLDPGLGWAHRDAPYRDSAALDLLEPIRPRVDRYVLHLLSTRTFGRREFRELRDGRVRLSPELARSLAVATLTAWEDAAGAQAQRIARSLAETLERPVRVPSQGSRGARGKGAATLGRRVSTTTPTALPSACRECGVMLDAPDRAYCDDCLPQFKAQRTDKLVVSARSLLAQMRTSANDPAQSEEAKARRVASYTKRRSASRIWEKANPGPHDHGRFRTEILPRLADATLPQMMRATGLSSAYCWKIRRGDRVPHPMYWEALRALAETAMGGRAPSQPAG